jgi:hypothetical protein
MVHHETNQLVIGPHVIDAEGSVRTVRELVDIRVTATMRHLHEPKRMVYMLGMEGELFELDLESLACRQIANLVQELRLPQGAQPHFKGAFATRDRVFVTNNTYDERDYLGTRRAGRLAEWDGASGPDAWNIVEQRSFYEVYGRLRLGGVVYAAGWDAASAILMVRVGPGDDYVPDAQKAGSPVGTPVWRRFRLPKASANYEHTWQHEWPRIREIEHERILADVQGMFYELSPHAYGGHPMPVRPIGIHLPAITDFTNFRGMMVTGSNQMTPFNGDNVLVGEPDSGVWVGKTDDLWKLGKPKGWGGPWRRSTVAAGEPSDPYLMTGFEHKGLHLHQTSEHAVCFTVELDVLGDGTWTVYDTFKVAPGGAVHHGFPSGVGAHWARVTADTDCTATAQFVYG